MAATKKTEIIDIKPIEFAYQPVTIKGTTPLIVHAWSHKAKQAILDKQTGKASKAKHELKVPRNDFMESLNWLTEKPELGKNDDDAESIWLEAVESGAKFGFPVSGIKQSIVNGAYWAGLDVQKTKMRSTFFLEGLTESSTPDMAEIVGPTPEMREDMVRVGTQSKSADIRYRPEFAEWEIPMMLKYNVNGIYSIEQILNFFNYGGFACGIGEWRPEKDGQYGMYQLVVS